VVEKNDFNQILGGAAAGDTKTTVSSKRGMEKQYLEINMEYGVSTKQNQAFSALS
jgi:hypothetical protein